MTRHILGVLAGALGLLALTAQAALAHEELTPQTAQTGKPVFLTMSAANEGEEPVTRIALTVPAGATLAAEAAIRSPAGWKATISGSTITWTGGTLPPGTFEEFGFRSRSSPSRAPWCSRPRSPAAATPSRRAWRSAWSRRAPPPRPAPAAATSWPPARPAMPPTAQTRATLAVGLGAAALVVALTALGLLLLRGRAATTGATRSRPTPQDF